MRGRDFLWQPDVPGCQVQLVGSYAELGQYIFNMPTQHRIQPNLCSSLEGTYWSPIDGVGKKFDLSTSYLPLQNKKFECFLSPAYFLNIVIISLWSLSRERRHLGARVMLLPAPPKSLSEAQVAFRF